MRSDGLMRVLRVAAGAELATLAALLVNLATVHTEVVSSLGGPLHGMAYLVTIATTWQVTTADARATRWCAVLPGIGGLLVLRRLRSRPPADGSPARP
ncbi:hypothetical protein [Streptomyces pactum]|uniref:hypothetical protein n=1 Tax=Streptomyces pactum TaxID=68249 RepID=UPI0036F6142C